MDLRDKNVLVVGATGTFGKLISADLIGRGAKVWATASSNDSAPNVVPGVQQILLLDLKAQPSIDAVANYLNQNLELDGIVIAAGQVGFGTIAETTSSQVHELNQVNFLGPASLVTQLLPNLRAEGFVAAITGIVAEKSFPAMAAYCASKSAFASWLGVLRSEVRSKRIQVLDARPGHTETGLATRAIFGTAPKFPEGMAPEHVAEVIVTQLLAGSSVISSEQF